MLRKRLRMLLPMTLVALATWDAQAQVTAPNLANEIESAANPPDAPSAPSATAPSKPAAVPAAMAAAAGAPAATRPQGWRTPQGAADSDEAALKPVTPNARPAIARVTKGSGSLPNEQGQIWREYDISSYTTRVTSTSQPEMAIIDWILSETRYETWHGDPLGMLSANRKSLRCYHTPEVQAVVAEIVDRFVNSEAETHAFGMRIVTIGNPNWRAKAIRLMKPVPVQSQGVQGWLLAKEDAALLIAEMQKRSDYREHSSPHMLVNNGQAKSIPAMRSRQYAKGILLNPSAWPGYELERGTVEEGFELEFTPLLSLDGQTIDSVIKLRLNQVERMVPVTLEVPTVVATRQRTQIEVPQMTSSNLHERFRWPADQVLLLSMGVIATPAPEAPNPITSMLPLPQTPARADALLFIESRGKVTAAPTTNRTADQATGSTQRRY